MMNVVHLLLMEIGRFQMFCSKAFLIAIYGDFFHCFLGPLVVLLNSSDAARRLRQLYRAVIQTLRTK